MDDSAKYRMLWSINATNQRRIQHEHKDNMGGWFRPSKTARTARDKNHRCCPDDW